MNKAFKETLAKAFSEVEDLLGESFTFRGRSYTGIISSDTLGYSLESGGFQESASVSVTISKSALTEKPKSGEVLILPDGKFRIDKVDSDFLTWQLTCSTATK